MQKKFLFIFSLFYFPLLAFSQNDSIKNDTKEQFWYYDLEKLMHAEISVTNPLKKDDIDHTPAIISVITKEEIRHSGARDLLDILQIIPGFAFGTDVHSQLGILSRGIWAFEGKVLILIDGHMLNELMYGTVPLEYHIPVENIKKIEIIRGASSVLYGGFAELAVINIITEDSDDFQGVKAGTEYGFTQKTPLFEKQGYFMYGKTISNTGLSFFAKYGQTYRSDRTYHDVYQDSFPMTQNIIEPMQINAKLSHKNLKIKLLYDFYHTTTRDYFGTNLHKAYPKDFTTFGSIIQYSYQRKNIELKPELSIKYDLPWVSTEQPADAHDSLLYYSLKQSVLRITPRVTANFEINNQIDILGGIEANFDKAKNLTADPSLNFWNGQPEAHLATYTGFSQINIQKNNLTASLGARAEYNTFYGFDFVPRFGVTYNLEDKIFVKAMANRAYRSPTFANIDFNYMLFIQNKYPKIKPEKTNFFNLEVHTKFGNSTDLTMGLFRNSTQNAISYFVDDQGNEGYANITSLGTSGFEVAMSTKYSFIYAFASYSFYNKNTPESQNIYTIEQLPNVYIGAPQHKFTFIAHINTLENLSINPWFIFYGSKYAYTSIDTLGQLQYSKLPEEFLLNVSVVAKDFPVKNFEFNFAIFNIINTKSLFAQPYDGWHAPVPGRSREIRLTFSYKFGKK